MYVIMGATGNIGSKLANILPDKGEKVTVIGRSAERLKSFVDRGAEAAVGDVSDVGFLTHVFKNASCRGPRSSASFSSGADKFAPSASLGNDPGPDLNLRSSNIAKLIPP